VVKAGEDGLVLHSDNPSDGALKLHSVAPPAPMSRHLAPSNGEFWTGYPSDALKIAPSLRAPLMTCQ
jgi:hypothetical protein